MTDDDLTFLDGSTADRAVAWYRQQLRLRRAVAVLALPALSALTGLGMLIDPGPISWLLAILVFISAGELFTTSRRLRRDRRDAERRARTTAHGGHRTRGALPPP
jgi:uncharacterized membrane protein YfcA